MRQIEKKMVAALNGSTSWREANTRVECENGRKSVYLHGNCIYQADENGARWSFRGWATQTTKSRLRALGVNYKAVGGSVYDWHEIGN